MRDSVKRFIKISSAEKYGIVVRRLICEECGKLHRELPDFLLPHKHYPTQCIEAEIDSGGQNKKTEDCGERIHAYPELSTCMRWKHEFTQKREKLNEMQLLVWKRANSSCFSHTAYASCNYSLFMERKKTGVSWLADGVRTAVNAGLFFCTEFAFSMDSAAVMMKVPATHTGDMRCMLHSKKQNGGCENMEKNQNDAAKWLLWEIRRVHFLDNTAFMASALGISQKVLQNVLNSNGGQRFIEVFEEVVRYCVRNQLGLDALISRYPRTQDLNQGK